MFVRFLSLRTNGVPSLELVSPRLPQSVSIRPQADGCMILLKISGSKPYLGAISSHMRLSRCFVNDIMRHMKCIQGIL